MWPPVTVTSLHPIYSNTANSIRILDSYLNIEYSVAALVPRSTTACSQKFIHWSSCTTVSIMREKVHTDWVDWSCSVWRTGDVDVRWRATRDLDTTGSRELCWCRERRAAAARHRCWLRWETPSPREEPILTRHTTRFVNVILICTVSMVESRRRLNWREAGVSQRDPRRSESIEDLIGLN